MIPSIQHVQIRKSTETESRLMIAEGREAVERDRRVTASGHRVSFWDYKNVIKLDCGNCCTTL